MFFGLEDSEPCPRGRRAHGLTDPQAFQSLDASGPCPRGPVPPLPGVSRGASRGLWLQTVTIEASLVIDAARSSKRGLARAFVRDRGSFRTIRVSEGLIVAGNIRIVTFCATQMAPEPRTERKLPR